MAYRDFVANNGQAVVQIEGLLRSLSYLLPGTMLEVTGRKVH